MRIIKTCDLRLDPTPLILLPFIQSPANSINCERRFAMRRGAGSEEWIMDLWLIWRVVMLCGIDDFRGD